MIVQETIKIVNEQTEVKKILSLEEELRIMIDNLLSENEYLDKNLNEILYLYSVGELEKLEEKLKHLVSRINK